MTNEKQTPRRTFLQTLKRKCLVAGLVFAGLGALYVPIEIHCLSEPVTITVTDKERTMSHQDSKFLVYTKHEVFENTDALWKLKFNSSDVQGKLMVGETYNVRVTGLRIPFLSWHRNIVKVED
jgi:hypothetical protein